MTPFTAETRYLQWDFQDADTGEHVNVHGASFISFHASAPVKLFGSYDEETWFPIADDEVLEDYVELSIHVNYLRFTAPRTCKVHFKAGAV